MRFGGILTQDLLLSYRADDIGPVRGKQPVLHYDGGVYVRQYSVRFNDILEDAYYFCLALFSLIFITFALGEIVYYEHRNTCFSIEET